MFCTNNHSESNKNKSTQYKYLGTQINIYNKIKQNQKLLVQINPTVNVKMKNTSKPKHIGKEN